jgi:hypothetical protein
MNVDIGTVAAQSFSWNICFKFSVLVLCSVISALAHLRDCSFAICGLIMKNLRVCELALFSTLKSQISSKRYILMLTVSDSCKNGAVRGEHTRLLVRGWGSPNSGKPSTMSTLWDTVILYEPHSRLISLKQQTFLFQKHSVNLVHIESRSSVRLPGYEFMVEVNTP